MNTTANLKRDPRSGIYRYRRTVPPRLVGLVEPVEGFEFIQERKYFEKSLGVRDKAPANRLASELDKLVSEALKRAERRLQSGVTAPAKMNSNPTAAAKIDIRHALKSLGAWADTRTDAADDRYVNAGEKPERSESDMLLATIPHDGRKAIWDGAEARKVIPDFDGRLVAALASQEIDITPAHAALRLLRAHVKINSLFDNPRISASAAMDSTRRTASESENAVHINNSQETSQGSSEA
jgi:hypothetical protein